MRLLYICIIIDSFVGYNRTKEVMAQALKDTLRKDAHLRNQ